ncbi:hypothetical protein M5689_000632 [Euphorbia peplus]|nr:hypothetical protein M5689_000632 [Euphorbia peplus]
MTLFRKIAKKSEHPEALKHAKKTTFKRKLKQEEDEVFETLENNAGLKMETKKEEEFEEFKSTKNKIPLAFDLNENPNFGFDLNKFPEEGAEVYENPEFQQVYMIMLKILLPNFY